MDQGQQNQKKYTYKKGVKMKMCPTILFLLRTFQFVCGPILTDLQLYVDSADYSSCSNFPKLSQSQHDVGIQKNLLTIGLAIITIGSDRFIRNFWLVGSHLMVSLDTAYQGSAVDILGKKKT